MTIANRVGDRVERRQAHDRALAVKRDAGTAGPGSVSVIICCYTQKRWAGLVRAIESVQAQTRQPEEIILVIDHNPELQAEAERRLDDVQVIFNEAARGLSGARNSGVAAARGEIVAFIDDDAQALPGWLESLLEPFEDPSRIGVGGVATPLWEARRPGWLPSEFLWVVGCSYRGVPTTREVIRNPIGANMAFRRQPLVEVGGFAHGIGRVGRTPLGCEETELAIRVTAATGGTIVQVPESEVLHSVTDARVSWRYFRSRCWGEGISKALVGRSVGAGSALASERTYVRSTLPTGVLSGLNAARRGDATGLGRAGAIVAGLAITAAGYGWGLVVARDRRR